MFWHTAAITQDNVADGFVKEVSNEAHLFWSEVWFTAPIY